MTLNDLLQACVMAINESGMEPNVAVEETVQIYDPGIMELVDPCRVKWSEADNSFVIEVG